MHASPECPSGQQLIGITKSILMAAGGHNLHLISLLGRLIKCYQLMVPVKGDTMESLSQAISGLQGLMGSQKYLDSRLIFPEKAGI